MRIPSGSTDRKIYFVALDGTENPPKTRLTGLTNFTVSRSRNGAASLVYTTPTITEVSAANMPGVYALLLDEDTGISTTHDTEEYCVHISHAGMASLTRTVELYRPKATEGKTITFDASNNVNANMQAGEIDAEIDETALAEIAQNVLKVGVGGTVEAAADPYSLCSLILACFEYSISGTTWSIKRTDGTTVHMTKTLSSIPSPEGVTAVT